MNIAEILKDCPKGTKLYCTIYGEVELYRVDLNTKFPISVRNNRNNEESLTEEGKLYIGYDDGECLLFPSKENRDWSTFKIPKKEKECDFKPFDKVLVRDNDSATWNIDLFSYIVSDSAYKYKYSCLNADWKQCIPYEGNEHLVGTSKCV